MTTISLDFETRSTLDLRKTGVYPYAAHPTTDLWCMAYAVEQGEVDLWIPGDPIPMLFHEVAFDESIVFRAWNANFERTIWREIMAIRYGFPPIDLERWHCTMAEAAMLGLPQALKSAAAVLNVEQQKDDDGHRLMMQMLKPRKPRKDEDPDARLWWDDSVRLDKLAAYCRQDVRAEVAIAVKIAPLARGMGREREVYLLDQRINDRGVPIDMCLVRAARAIADEGIARASVELHGLTDGIVDAPTQVKSMKEWIASHGVVVDSLNKMAIRDLLEENHLKPEVRRLLEIRQNSGKSSVAKLDALLHYAQVDDRARGMLQYHSAHTGRWGGRGPQPQNMTRPEHDDPESFIPMIMLGDYDALEAVAPPIVAVSDILRSCFAASEGCKFIGGDFSSIEMHVLSWLAGQEDSASYYEMAGEIFGVDPASIEKGSTEYMVGKVAILACGYQMGPPKFEQTVFEWTGLVLDPDVYEINDDGDEVLVKEGTARIAVRAYRNRHPQIVTVWGDYNDAVLAAVQMPGQMYSVGRIRFMAAGNFLWARLPSGRRLAYPLPEIRMRSLPEPYEHVSKPAVIVRGVDSVTRRWSRKALYGGLIAENITQAVARDIMVDAMLRADPLGYSLILTVHDELLCETPLGHSFTAGNLQQIMTVVPDWATGCHIAAEVWEDERFRK